MTKQKSEQKSEPESYSVDDMMERLREGEREKEDQSSSELVTRPDGTQVMRVRKRKRRSKQVEEEAAPQKSRRTGTVLLVLAVVMIVVLGVGVIILMARYNSAGFRKGFESSLGEAVGAEATLNGMAVTPLAGRAKSLKLTWGDDRALDSLVLRGLSAELGMKSFLFGSWSGDLVTAQSGELVLGGALTESAGRDAGEAPLSFAEYRCAFLNIHFGQPGTGGLFKNVELSMRAGPIGETQLLLSKGEAKLPGWETLVIDRGMAEVQDGDFKLVSLRLRPKVGGGEINFSSDQLLHDGDDVRLGIDLDEIPLSTVLGKELGGILSGTISSESGSLVLDHASMLESEFRVEFAGTSAFLEGLPFQQTLRSRLGDSEFIKPEINHLNGVLIRNKSGVRLQELDLVMTNLMTVRGHLEVDAEGQLDGRLEVGVAVDKIMTSTSRKRIKVFSDAREGFCWVTITLGGTIEDPEDDFQALLQKSARESAPRSKEKVLEDRFDELTR